MVQNIIASCAVGLFMACVFCSPSVVGGEPPFNNRNENKTVTCINNHNHTSVHCWANETCCGRYNAECCPKTNGKSWKIYLILASGMVGTAVLLGICCVVYRSCCYKSCPRPFDDSSINPLVIEGPPVSLPYPEISKTPNDPFSYMAQPRSQGHIVEDPHSDNDGGPLYVNLVEPPPKTIPVSEL